MVVVSKDKSKLQLDIIHSFLTNCYWAKGRTIEEVKKSIEHSLCFGVYLDGKQIGFARVATDYTIFAYLMDIFILPDYRGKGYSMELLNAINDAPELQPCKVWMLKTVDAHGLYKKFGYSQLSHPERIMERISP